ncbi:MAG TPA: hypothetical protein VGV07_08320 [Devosia sp.]|jgi:hypothetical protein|uniref:hypothetical protein n=1 Tax=Devosia sp. TaxID=1871048 RepID=UPI002DDD95C7|nr:hypothetical protein [Devosia sp.]HEV2515240.1 hypothetical protein [Devosia sp.]
MQPLPALVLSCLAALSILTGGASPAQLSIIDLDSPEGRQSYLDLAGDIEVGDWFKFVKLLRQHPRTSGVLLNSAGGSADDGLAIARHVYEHRLDTMVTDACHSVCTIIFLAGARRFLAVDADLSVHSAYKQLADWVVEDHLANGTVAWFIGHMGYPLPIARLWVSTASDETAPITLE